MIRRPLLFSTVVTRLTSVASVHRISGVGRKSSRVLALGCTTVGLLAAGMGCAKKPAAEPVPLAPPSPVAVATPAVAPPAQPVASSPAPSGDAQAIGEYLVFVGQIETQRQALLQDMAAFAEQQTQKMSQMVDPNKSTNADVQTALQETTARIAQWVQQANALKESFHKQAAPAACNELATAYGGAVDALAGMMQSAQSAQSAQPPALTQDTVTPQLTRAAQELERLRKDTPGLPSAALSFTIATQ